MTSEQIHIGNMSHETAIGILKLMLEAMETYDGISPTPARINAIKMAIEALEQEPTTKNDLGVDLISRADAIRVASGYCHPSNVAKELAKLPSVTPQEPTGKNFTKADIDAIVKAINKGWELRVNEILSKIRAEILEEHENAYAREDDDTAYGLSMALDILDKYKAETEDTDGTNK